SGRLHQQSLLGTEAGRRGTAMTPLMRQMHPLHPSWPNKAGPSVLWEAAPLSQLKTFQTDRQTGHIWGATNGRPSPFPSSLRAPRLSSHPERGSGE
ncbi:hypothetical protein KUCAC02_021144, partial [Chaenocephalus aceratus]